MERKYAKITHSTHPFNWWNRCVGQIVPILDVFEKTGYTKIRAVFRHEMVGYDHPYGGIGFRVGTAAELEDIYIDPHYEKEGWIPPDFLVELE